MVNPLACKNDRFGKNTIRLKNSLQKQEKVTFGHLFEDIIKPGICTTCGAYAATCPVKIIIMVNSVPKIADKCIGYGICYNQCPRTITTEISLIGNIRQGYAARSNLQELWRTRWRIPLYLYMPLMKDLLTVQLLPQILKKSHGNQCQ